MGRKSLMPLHPLHSTLIFLPSSFFLINFHPSGCWVLPDLHVLLMEQRKYCFPLCCFAVWPPCLSRLSGGWDAILSVLLAYGSSHHDTPIS